MSHSNISVINWNCSKGSLPTLTAFWENHTDSIQVVMYTAMSQEKLRSISVLWDSDKVHFSWPRWDGHGWVCSCARGMVLSLPSPPGGFAPESQV